MQLEEDEAAGAGEYFFDNGMADIPEASVVDTESSDGALSHTIGFDEESDGDHERDGNYVMSQSDSEDGSSDGKNTHQSPLCLSKTKRKARDKVIL